MRATNHGTRWDNIEDQDLAIQYLRGDNIGSIADFLGRSPGAVRKRIRYLRDTNSLRRLVPSEAVHAAAGPTEAGAPDPRDIGRSGKPWQAKETARAINLLRDGETTYIIAVILGRTAGEVSHHLADLASANGDDNPWIEAAECVLGCKWSNPRELADFLAGFAIDLEAGDG